MLKTEYIINPPDIRYLSENPEKILFFDIETTGLSPERSHLYLIGCAREEQGQWILRQWFAQNSSEEFAILEQFLSVVKDCRLLVSYNGASFDLPYLRQKCRAYLLPDAFQPLPMTDLYRELKPLRKLLALPQLRQADVERWLGLYRDDCYNGKELITVYRRYQKNQDRELLSALLLHNREDVEGMTVCTAMLAYPDAVSGNYSFLKGSADDRQCTFQYQLSAPVPKAVRYVCPQVSLQERTLTLFFPIKDGSIYLYLPDHENYMYLPDEQLLIHKKLARLTKPSNALPATPETCRRKLSVGRQLLSNERNALLIAGQTLQWLFRR